MVLAPSNREFTKDRYDYLCLIDGMLQQMVSSWYGKWSIISSHTYHHEVTEWLMGILNFYRVPLERAKIQQAVTVALYSYP